MIHSGLDSIYNMNRPSAFSLLSRDQIAITCALIAESSVSAWSSLIDTKIDETISIAQDKVTDYYQV